MTSRRRKSRQTTPLIEKLVVSIFHLFKPKDPQIRRYSLYAIKLSNGNYYIGLTSRSDVMKRINEHGGRKGAYINRGLRVVGVIESRRVGVMSLAAAMQKENDMTREYQKRYGLNRASGGYMVMKGYRILPTYPPGSNADILQKLVQVIVILLIIFICFALILARFPS